MNKKQKEVAEYLEQALRSCKQENGGLELSEIIKIMQQVFDDEELFIISNSLKK